MIFIAVIVNCPENAKHERRSNQSDLWCPSVTSSCDKGERSELPLGLTGNTKMRGKHTVAASTLTAGCWVTTFEYSLSDRHMHTLHSHHFGGDLFLGWGLCSAEGERKREEGWVWHQPGADIIPVAPLAAPTPSVICVNICKPKVPLSPNVRAVCLAFPLRKPGVIHQNKTY